MYVQSSQVTHWLRMLANAGFDRWIRRSPGDENGNHSVFLPGNPADRGAWRLEPAGPQQAITWQRRRNTRAVCRAGLIPLCPFPALCSHCIFYKVRGSGNTGLREVHYFSSICSFVFLCPILVILAIFQSFYYYICYGDSGSMIFDVTVVIALGHHKPQLYTTVNLALNVVCVLTSPLTG